ncbi:ankyrin repeat-containing domain protein [Lasiosphaeria miniovina]|uniref:Ankyrin repeat-containing domain protein n=1 Tax=Lasiosphaeria miniovina TaxID=1954250 RepID=A0AA40ATK0_9PEZI|nr:ankyrin repeat-containing domain protein [Lasiosphaeria miniovina]KAK0721755.1 ankyrin repeat-containing domain protein [Lasiosphaeria miniovina]
MAAVMSRVPDLDAESRIGIGVLPTTAMAEAAWAGDIEVCKILIARGARPNPVAASSLSALQIAAHLGNMPLATMLVEKGANVNYSFNGYLDIGSEPTTEDLVGLEPLLPELPGREETVRRLVVSQGEAFTAKALLNAVRRGDLSLAKLLVGAGADYHIMETGLTRYDPAALLAATVAASSATSSSTFDITLDSRRGVGRFHYHQTNEAWTAFLEGMALAAARTGYLLRFNLRHDSSEVFGVGPRSRHDHALTTPGATILGTACMAKQPAMVPILLGRGYQPSHVDLVIAARLIDQTTTRIHALASGPSSSTPLEAAIFYDDIKLVSHLLSRGAHVSPDLCPSSSPLAVATGSGNIAMVKLLIAHGAGVNASSSGDSGFPLDPSPLEQAAESGKIDVLAYLLSEGVDTAGGVRR